MVRLCTSSLRGEPWPTEDAPMLKSARYAAVAFALLAAGCGTDEDDDESRRAGYAPLFSASSAAVTHGSIYGVWAGHLEWADGSLDVRFKFAPDALTGANRCIYNDGFSVIVGVTAAATITESEINVRESKDDVFNDGKHRCNINARPARTAYTIDGDRMTIDNLELLKVSD